MEDICDTHFYLPAETQVDSYLVQGNGERKLSTPKQLAVALINSSASNMKVLLVKPDFTAPYCRAAIPPYTWHIRILCSYM